MRNEVNNWVLHVIKFTTFFFASGMHCRWDVVPLNMIFPEKAESFHRFILWRSHMEVECSPLKSHKVAHGYPGVETSAQSDQESILYCMSFVLVRELWGLCFFSLLPIQWIPFPIKLDFAISSKRIRNVKQAFTKRNKVFCVCHCCANYKIKIEIHFICQQYNTFEYFCSACACLYCDWEAF